MELRHFIWLSVLFLLFVSVYHWKEFICEERETSLIEAIQIWLGMMEEPVKCISKKYVILQAGLEYVAGIGCALMYNAVSFGRRFFARSQEAAGESLESETEEGCEDPIPILPRSSCNPIVNRWSDDYQEVEDSIAETQSKNTGRFVIIDRWSVVSNVDGQLRRMSTELSHTSDCDLEQCSRTQDFFSVNFTHKC